MSDGITNIDRQELVPSGYAEKSMASLMQLHSELMDEKERRVELYRRLMEKEQAVSELRSYVKLLEARLSRLKPRAVPAPEASPPPAPAPAPQVDAARAPPRAQASPPEPVQVRAKATGTGGRAPIFVGDAWRSW